MLISKKASKILKLFVLQIAFFSLTSFNCYCSFFNNFITHIITESSVILAKYFPLSQIHVAGLQLWSFSHYVMIFTLTSTFVFPKLIWITFFPSNLHLHSDYTSFVKIVDSLFPIILLKTCIFQYCFILNTYSLKVLQIPTYLSNLTTTG